MSHASPTKTEPTNLSDRLEQLRPRGVNKAYRVLRCWSLAEDAVQEAHFAIYHRSEVMEEEIASLSSYYFRTVYHKSLSILDARLQETLRDDLCQWLDEKQEPCEMEQGLVVLHSYLVARDESTHAATLQALMDAMFVGGEAAKLLNVSDGTLSRRKTSLVKHFHNHLSDLLRWLDDPFGDSGQLAKLEPSDPMPTGTGAEPSKPVDCADGAHIPRANESMGSDARRNRDAVTKAILALRAVYKLCYEESLNVEPRDKLSRLHEEFEGGLLMDSIEIRSRSLSSEEARQIINRVESSHRLVALIEEILSGSLRNVSQREIGFDALFNRSRILRARLHLHLLITDALNDEVRNDMSPDLLNQLRFDGLSEVSIMRQRKRRDEEVLNLLAALHHLLPREFEMVFKMKRPQRSSGLNGLVAPEPRNGASLDTEITGDDSVSS